MLQWKGEYIPVKPNSKETQQTLSVCAVFQEAGDRFMSLQAGTAGPARFSLRKVNPAFHSSSDFHFFKTVFICWNMFKAILYSALARMNAVVAAAGMNTGV